MGTLSSWPSNWQARKKRNRSLKKPVCAPAVQAEQQKLSANWLLAIPQATFIWPLHPPLLEKQHSYPTAAENKLLKDLLFKYLFTML